MSVDPVENTDILHTFHADEDIGNAKDIFKQKLSHALGCLHIKPSLFHSLVVSKKYDSIEGVLKKYLCSVIQGHSYEAPDDVFVPEVRTGYSPHVKKADLSTIQEAYQYLMKKFVIIPREKQRRICKIRNITVFNQSKDSSDDSKNSLHCEEDEEEKDPEMIESARILAELQELEEKSKITDKGQFKNLEEMNRFSDSLNDLILKEFAELNMENRNFNSPLMSRSNSGKRLKRGSKKHLDHLGTPTNGSRRGSRNGSIGDPDELLLNFPKHLYENHRKSQLQSPAKSVSKRGSIADLEVPKLSQMRRKSLNTELLASGEDQHLDLPNFPLGFDDVRRQSVDVAMLGSGARRKSDTPYPARRGSSFKLKK